VASTIQRASASQKRLNEFLDTRPGIADSPRATEIDQVRSIRFEAVDFTYPHTGIQALRKFKLDIRAGQKIAVIGPTGSGKSTIAQLMMRMYDPSSGSIRVNEEDIRTYTLESLRRRISYVPQDVFLFSDTVRNNIRFGNDGAGEEEVLRAARAAAVDQEILGFSHGYETMIGERGVNLSGGQKQRLSIARALCKEADLLLFDDCLSAVDARTEKRILSGLGDALREKTAIVITHRIFSLFEFDQVIVLQDGAIVEQGTHRELMENNGYYADLYRRQQDIERDVEDPEMQENQGS
jgi:ATP-binding cassette subfamily B protein